MIELVYAGDTTSPLSSIMFASLIKAVQTRTDVRIKELIAVRRKGLIYALARQTFLISVLRYIVIKLFNWNYSWNYHGNIVAMAKTKHIKVSGRLHPFNGESLLSVAYPYRIKPEILNSLAYAVNYHNSLLPKYGGLHSTAFSVYFGEVVTGYTLHRMVAECDRGNVLLQGSLDVNGHDVKRLDLIKIQLAALHLDWVLYCIVNREVGRPQCCGGSYWGFKDWQEFLTCNSQDQDVAKKVKLFGFVWMQWQGRKVLVTKVKNNGQPERICYLPVSLYALVQRLFTIS